MINLSMLTICSEEDLKKFKTDNKANIKEVRRTLKKMNNLITVDFKKYYKRLRSVVELETLKQIVVSTCVV